MENCLRHGKRFRYRLEFVINQLRKAGKLTHSQSVGVGEILCTCDIKDRSKQQVDIVDSEFCKAYTLIQQLLDPGQGCLEKQDIFSSHCAKVLPDVFKALENVNQDGLKRLVLMLYKIVMSEFDSTYPTNLKKDKLITKLSLNFPRRYIGFFIGKDGRWFQEIETKADSRIKLLGTEMMFDTEYIVIRIESGSERNIDMARSLLIERALKITEKRSLHDERVRYFRHWMRREAVTYSFTRPVIYIRNHHAPKKERVFQDIKNLNRDEYDRKKFNQQKMHNSGTKVKGYQVLAEGSRCLNCLGTYAATEMKEGACKFHPGFIVDGAWSCCGRSSVDQHPSHNDHKMTGCSNSVHNYRPTKKRHGKSNLNSHKEWKSPLLQDGAELLQDLKLEG